MYFFNHRFYLQSVVDMKKYVVFALALSFCSPLLVQAKQNSSADNHTNSGHKKTHGKKEKKESWTPASSVFIDMRGTMFWIRADNVKKK